MYHVSAQKVDERMINVHYYYYISKLKELHNLSSEKQNKETMISPFAHWSLLHYSFHFIEGRGAINVYTCDERLKPQFSPNQNSCASQALL